MIYTAGDDPKGKKVLFRVDGPDAIIISEGKNEYFAELLKGRVTLTASFKYRAYRDDFISAVTNQDSAAVSRLLNSSGTEVSISKD